MADIAKIIRNQITHNELLDIVEIWRGFRKVGGKKAKEAGLNQKRALKIAGFITYDRFVQAAEERNLPVGEKISLNDCFPGTELRCYQPVWVFGNVVVGVASINQPLGLPSANKTRKNGALLNRQYSLNFPLPTMQQQPISKEANLYALLVAQPDPSAPEKFMTVELVVLESDFSGVIFRCSVDEFLAGYSEAAPEAATPPKLRLKTGVAPFDVGGDISDEEKKRG